MKEKVVEILIYIMSEIQSNKRLGEIDLVALRSKGYTQSEISAAFNWLYDSMYINDSGIAATARPSPSSIRMLHDAEKEVLTVECQGYLIQLQQLGLLDGKDMEIVIERAMMSGYERISLPELREIVAAVMFARGDDGENRNRSMLDSGDTVH